MRYVMNPVEVEAVAIKTVRGAKDSNAGGRIGTGEECDFILLLEDGREFRPGYGMTSRMVPAPGDYIVIQEGRSYLNSKEFFERNYHAVSE